MITVKLFGLLRLNYGIREQTIEAGTVKEVLEKLTDRGIPKQELNGCIILVNGSSANKRTKLAAGDTVVLMSPVAGG